MLTHTTSSYHTLRCSLQWLWLTSSLDLSFYMYLYVGKQTPGHGAHTCPQAIQNSWHFRHWGSAGSLRGGQLPHPIAPVESLETFASFGRAETLPTSAALERSSCTHHKCLWICSLKFLFFTQDRSYSYTQIMFWNCHYVCCYRPRGSQAPAKNCCAV